MAGYERLEVRGRRRSLRRPGQRRPDDVPRRRHLLRRLAHPRPARRRRRARRQPRRLERRARRARRRGRPRRPPTSSPTGCAVAASRPRSPRARRSSASRSGTPSGAASRTSGSSRTTAATRSRTSAAATRSTPTPTRGTHRPPTSTRRSSPPSATRSNSRDPHPRRRHPHGRRRRPDRHPRRLGGPPPRPRRRGLPRPARGQRRRPGRGPRRERRAQPAQRVLRRGHRHGRSCAPRATPTRTCRPARSRSIADTVEVLSAAAPLPFPIDDHVDVGEEARLKHRYLDLRRSGPNAALRLRSKVNKAARDVLDRHDFVEVETPTLTRSTPEGARDFLVPARLQPGQLVRPAAEPAAVQAAADGRRHGALLPDRPLLPRRGLPRRPAAGVHPARHRDELRRPGRRDRDLRGGAGRAVEADRRRPAHARSRG